MCETCKKIGAVKPCSTCTDKPSKVDPLGQQVKPSEVGAQHKLNIEPGRDFGGSQTKPSNPKDSVGIRKAPMSTVPAPVLFEIGLAMLEGARKYGRHNYRAVGVRTSVYYDAFMRHVAAWWEGEDVDPASGLPHLSKAAACLVVLRDSIRRGNCTDDRPPKVEDGWIEKLNKLAEGVIDKYPESKEAFVDKKMPLKVIKYRAYEPITYNTTSIFQSLAPLEKAHPYEPLGPCEFEPATEQLDKQVEDERKDLMMKFPEDD